MVDADDRKNPLWPQVVEAVKQLEEVNAAVYGSADPTKEQVARKNQLQKDLNRLVGKIGRKYRMAPEMWRGKWSGYTGSTPCSDGRLVWFTSCMGVVGSYDLDGKKRWMSAEPVTGGQMGEHGGGSSPVLVGDLLIHCLNSSVIALDGGTGKPVWRREYHGGDDAPTVVPLRAGDQTYVIGKKHFLAAGDGREVEFKDLHLQAMSMFATPVTAGSVAYMLDSAGRLFWCGWESSADGGLKVSRMNLLEFPLADESKRWENGVNFWVPSPLYLKGARVLLKQPGSACCGGNFQRGDRL